MGHDGAVVAEGAAEERSPLVHSVIKAFALLERLGEAPAGLSLSDLSRQNELHPSTAHRLLHTLIEIGYVQQDARTRRYLLGPRAAGLGSKGAARPHGGLPELAAPQLRSLAEAVGESASLYLLDGDMVLHLAQSEGPGATRVSTPIGARLPAYCTAAGKVLLANLPQPALLDALERIALAPRTPNTITQRDDLLVELDRIRRRGFAVDDEEQEIGIRAVAAAVRDQAGASVAALSISGPTGRVNVHHLADLAHSAQAAAAQISQALRHGSG